MSPPCANINPLFKNQTSPTNPMTNRYSLIFSKILKDAVLQGHPRKIPNSWMEEPTRTL